MIFRAFAFYVLCLFLIATSFLVNKDEYIFEWFLKVLFDNGSDGNLYAVGLSYRFFDLAFVSLDLLLEFVDRVFVLVVSLAFFLGLHRQLAKASFLFSHCLLRVLETMLLRLKLDFQLADAVLQLLNDFASSFHCIRLGFVQASLQLFHL